MELLYEKVKEKIANDKNFTIENLSKEELMTIWYEESHPDSHLVSLFNTTFDKVAGARKRKGVMKKFVTEENERKRLEIIRYQNEKSYKENKKNRDLKFLLDQQNWLLGVLNVFLEEAKSIEKNKEENQYIQRGGKSFYQSYKIELEEGKPLSFGINYFHDEESIRMIYHGDNYSKKIREKIWSFFQVIEKKIRKIGFTKISYVKISDVANEPKIEMEIYKEFAQKVSCRKPKILDLFGEYLDGHIEECPYEFIHYLGKKEWIDGLNSFFHIEELEEEHYALRICNDYLLNKNKKEKYLVYSAAEELLKEMNLCVFSRLINVEN